MFSIEGLKVYLFIAFFMEIKYNFWGGSQLNEKLTAKESYTTNIYLLCTARCIQYSSSRPLTC